MLLCIFGGIMKYLFLTISSALLLSVMLFYFMQANRITKLEQYNKDLQNKIKEDSVEIFKLKENVSVIDASIEPDNKRWAKIKQVRKIVTDVLKEKGKNNLTVIDITNISSYIVDFSREYDIEISLILAMITVESAFDIRALSSANARGLMQILPDTAIEISGDLNRKYYNLFKPKDNIQFGTWYVWKLQNYFNGDMELAISAYNCGPTFVERVRSGQYESYPKQTVDYLRSVLEWKHRFQNLGVD